MQTVQVGLSSSLRCKNVCPLFQPDDPQTSDDYNLGNDLVGSAIAAVVKAGVRGQVDVYNRKDVKALIK